MRILHLIFAVFLAALLMAIAREEVGRVALVVFFTGLGEVVCATVALMTLFQALGAIGQADRPVAYLQAIASTALVLLVATLTMDAILCAGVWGVQVILP